MNELISFAYNSSISPSNGLDELMKSGARSIPVSFVHTFSQAHTQNSNIGLDTSKIINLFLRPHLIFFQKSPHIFLKNPCCSLVMG